MSPSALPLLRAGRPAPGGMQAGGGGHQHSHLSVPGALRPSYLKPLKPESPASHRCLGPHSTGAEGQQVPRRGPRDFPPGGGRRPPGTEGGSPGDERSLPGRLAERPQPTRPRRPFSGSRRRGAGPGPPQSRRRRAFRRSPARLAGDTSARTRDPGSHFPKCWRQSLRSPPRRLPGWRHNSHPDLRPAARRFWKAQPSSQPVLHAQRFSSRSWAGSGKPEWARV